MTMGMNPTIPLPPEEREELIRRLLAWAEAHRRDLPWRRDRTPYRVWVAEVMLQQTQTATVIPYFERFLARFPTVEALAAAPLDEVLKAWEGLGYYRRAHHLHAAAQEIVRRHGGRLPDTVEALMALPGIGRYTAGAIASLAFGRDVPVLDGNVRRVLCRLFAIADDPDRSATQRRLWALAESLLPPGRAGPFNEALMELGSLVCRPRRPACDRCPLRPFCQAHAQGIQETLPRRRRRPPLPHYQVTAAVIQDAAGRFLITRRPADAMLGGLWEFPGGKCLDGESLESCLRREIREELGVEIAVGERVTVVRHAYTHFRITLHAFRCRLVAGEPQTLGCEAWRWVTADELADYPFPAADHRIIAALLSA